MYRRCVVNSGSRTLAGKYTSTFRFLSKLTKIETSFGKNSDPDVDSGKFGVHQI